MIEKNIKTVALKAVSASVIVSNTLLLIQLYTIPTTWAVEIENHPAAGVA